ncbi:hypothetical protein V2W45_1213250, partial [Cenococcum geophilum]
AAPVVPVDMWICCECNGGNLVANADQCCPVCGHRRCSTCIGPGQPYSDTPAMGFPTDSLPPAGGAFASSSPSSSFGRLPASSPHEHHVSGLNNASIITNMGDDVWICCECGGTNLYELCP